MLSYEEALSWLFAQTRSGAPRSLERMRLLWNELGLVSPAHCIYVVGTNGKGSVSKMLAEGLADAGFSTGLFISPHVSDFRERISINGVHISQLRVRQFVERVKKLDLTPKPAFFEWSFALALEYFRDLDFAVIEAGVGARLDATNLLKNVRAVVITNVALDHQNSLGATVVDIARDKAAAIRTGIPTFTTASGEALGIIRESSQEQESPLCIVQQPKQTKLPLHLHYNQDLVKDVLNFFALPQKSITTALTSRPLPARLESFCIANRQVILDGAHNPHAAQALSSTFTTAYNLLFSAHDRKDAKRLLSILEQKALNVIVTSVSGQTPLLETPYQTITSPHEALKAALELDEVYPLLIAGSFYLAGELRSELIRLSS